jgi:Uma2 family endonuclease
MAEAARREDWPRSVAEFEAWHARQPERWEFIWGQPRLMAPGSLTHTVIKGNIFSALREALEGRDFLVLVDGAQIVTDEISAIPDLIVTCSALDLSTRVIAEPTIIVEVMSPWSEVDDTHRKWFSYRKIASLQHYLVVAQDRRVVEVHSRAGDLWRERFVSEGDIELDRPEVRLELDAVYPKTELAA